MSWAFVTALKKNPQQSYVQLLNSIRDELEGRYSQKPQLSCSHPLGTSGCVCVLWPRVLLTVLQTRTFCTLCDGAASAGEVFRTSYRAPPWTPSYLSWLSRRIHV